MSANRGAAADSISVPVERTDIHTCEPDSGVAVVKRLVIDHRARITVSAPQRVRVEVRSAATDGLGVDLLRFSGIGYHAEGEPSDCLLAAVLLAGHGQLTTTKQRLELRAGKALLAPMDSGWRTELEDMVYAVVRIPLSEVEEHIAEVCDLPDHRLRFQSMAPLAGTQRLWTDTSAFLYRQLVDSRTEGISPLMLHGLKRLTATALLTAFPNTTMTTAYAPGPGQSAPAVVRRAAQYIDDHAAEPLTLARIAAEVGLSPRALQAGFRRHLDTTPMNYLRRVRLASAHRDLQAADPSQAQTVESIAARWGFTHPARFAARYRQAYGVLPSHTLRA